MARYVPRPWECRYGQTVLAPSSLAKLVDPPGVERRTLCVAAQMSAKKRAIVEAGAFLGDGSPAVDGQRQLFIPSNMKLSSLKDAVKAPGVMGATNATLSKVSVSLTPKKLSELSQAQAAREVRAAALHRSPSHPTDSEVDDPVIKTLAFGGAQARPADPARTPERGAGAAAGVAAALGAGLSPLEESPLGHAVLASDRSEDRSARRHLAREVAERAAQGSSASFLRVRRLLLPAVYGAPLRHLLPSFSPHAPLTRPQPGSMT